MLASLTELDDASVSVFVGIASFGKRSSIFREGPVCDTSFPSPFLISSSCFFLSLLTLRFN